MDPASAYTGQAVFQPQSTQGHVLCCLCGTSILPNPSNMCVSCIRSQVDITDGIQKQLTILFCRDCGRYLQPPRHWVRADPESRELLTFCIKRVKGLSKVKLVDAGFIWTEPHSKRLKVKLTVQGEVLGGAILQQSFVIEYVVENHMCIDCNRHNANPNSWTACVQVRQHVSHKRSFLFLEQLVLKHNAAASAQSIKDIHEGIDFYFGHRGHALKFLDFLQNVVPCRFRHDKQLVSHDEHTSTYNYKYTFSVEILPLCKDDLVCLPRKASASLGGLGPLLLATRVTNGVTLTDVTTLRAVTMDAPHYYRAPFGAMANARQLVEYVVLDIEPLAPPPGVAADGRFALAEAQVARSSDFGRNDTVFFCRTHLGNVLHPGDHALGYDVANANLVGLDFDAHMSRGGSLPDVILVRKSYAERRRKARRRRGGAAAGGAARPWKLRALPMEVESYGNRRGGGGEEADEAERERFLEELEEDADLRSRINLYKVPGAVVDAPPPAAAARAAGGEEGEDEYEEDSDGEGLPQVPLEELLDELEGLGLDEGDDGEEEEGTGGGGGATEEMEH